MELKEFGKYLKYKSFQQSLHQVRRKSYDRILATERPAMSPVKGRTVKASAGTR